MINSYFNLYSLNLKVFMSNIVVFWHTFFVDIYLHLFYYLTVTSIAFLFKLFFSVINGNLPLKQLRLVQAWMEIHNDELIATWYCYNNDGEILKIKGLE